MASRERELLSGNKKSQTPSDIVNLDDIKELIDLIIEKGISEFELERSGVRIKIARHAGGRPVEAHVSSPEPTAAPANFGSASYASAREPAGRSAEPPASGTNASEGLYVVRSPMVGTFYAAPAQGAEVFVRVGDRVEVGQVLCIIEAMKLMNEIEAEVGGEVVKCYIENGQPVEYGEPLFELRPSAAAKKSS